MISRILFAILLLILGGMVYWVHGDVDRVHVDVLHLTTMMVEENNTVESKLDKLQRGFARIGKPRAPSPVKYLVKKPACFPES